MKKIILLLCLLSIVCLVYFTQIKGKAELSPTEEAPIAVTVISEQEKLEQARQMEQDLKRQAMTEKYAVLKETRKKLKIRLGRLSSQLRRTKFPVDQAQSISQDMRQANYHLKNPKLLGAFRDVDEIEGELESLVLINGKLDHIKALLVAQKNRG